MGPDIRGTGSWGWDPERSGSGFLYSGITPSPALAMGPAGAGSKWPFPSAPLRDGEWQLSRLHKHPRGLSLLVSSKERELLSRLAPPSLLLPPHRHLEVLIPMGVCPLARMPLLRDNFSGPLDPGREATTSPTLRTPPHPTKLCPSVPVLLASPTLAGLGTPPRAPVR